MIRPRFQSLPAGGRETRIAGRAVELAASAGLVLDDWQEWCLRQSMRTRGGRWAAFECALNVSRQNGKNGILAARQLAGLFLLGERLIIHSAHEFATAHEHYLWLEELIQATPELDEQVAVYAHANGKEAIRLKNGQRLLFKTRSKGAGRGFSCDLLMLDEAMFLAESSKGAILPTQRARLGATKYGPQIWYAGSAVDQEIHDQGLAWTEIRERGRSGDDSLFYAEWSAELDDVNELTEAFAQDERQRRVASPAWGVRIDPDHFEREFDSLDLRTFGVELLGVGDWPATSGAGEGIIPLEVWDDLADTSPLVEVAAVAFDVSPDRRASVALAGTNEQGRFAVELVESKSGTRWVPALVASLCEEHQLAVVHADGYGPAASVTKTLERDGLEVESVNAREHGQACGRFVDAVAAAEFRHCGRTEVRAALAGARTRPLGDAWAWSRKSSSVDISPLVAVTLVVAATIDAPATSDLVIW